MRVLLHSGGPLGPDGRREILGFLGGHRRVAFVTAASLHDETAYFTRVQSLLGVPGPEGAGLELLHLRWNDRPLDTLGRAEALFMGGGNTYALLKRLREAGLLKLSRLQLASPAKLETCVRPAGFCRQKTAAIRSFLDWLERFSDGSLARLFARPAPEVRRELLRVKGLGPETVDAILLYAGRQPFFVADAYTRRILSRHGLVPPAAGYDEVQEYLHRSLPSDPSLFNEFHALLVEAGKRFCKRREPNCDACPLGEFLSPADSGDADSDRSSELAAVATAHLE